MFKKLKEIVQGYTNQLKAKANVADTEVEQLASMRYNICLKCNERDDKNSTCKACGCYLGAKVRALKSSCPLHKW
jgi:ribosomal protein L32